MPPHATQEIQPQKGTKAQNESRKHFVLFVPFCGGF